MTLHLRYRFRRAHCPKCQTVKTERVFWATHGSNFTYAFEERAAFLAQQCSKTAIVALLRTTWRTVGTLIRRVVERSQEANVDRLDGLRLIGVDELSYRRHHKYTTVVVDHEQGRVVWAAEGKSAATLTRWALQKSSWNLTDVEAQNLAELEQTNQPLFRAHMLKESRAATKGAGEPEKVDVHRHGFSHARGAEAGRGGEPRGQVVEVICAG